MYRITFHLRSPLAIVIGLAISVAGSGCSDLASTSYPVTSIDLVREVFPSATEIIEISADDDVETSSRTNESIVSKIKGPSHLIGYLVESRVAGRSGPFEIAVLLDERLIVKRATVLSYPWPRGRKVIRRSFARQFEGKGPEDPIKIGKDIDAVTGATISCRAMATGVREAVKLLTD